VSGTGQLAGQALRFDVRNLVKEKVRTQIGDFVLSLLLAMAGAAVVGLGLLKGYLGIPPPALGLQASVGIALGGLLLLLGAWIRWPAEGRYPEYLEISREHLSLIRSRNKGSAVLSWTEPTLRLRLVDWRGVTAEGRGSRPSPPLTVHVGVGRGIPVPELAYEAILKQSELNGLQVKRVQFPRSLWRPMGDIVVWSVGPRI
jgi:hypothetical protein